jgi:hypothetical protein
MHLKRKNQKRQMKLKKKLKKTTNGDSRSSFRKRFEVSCGWTYRVVGILLV